MHTNWREKNAPFKIFSLLYTTSIVMLVFALQTVDGDS